MNTNSTTWRALCINIRLTISVYEAIGTKKSLCKFKNRYQNRNLFRMNWSIAPVKYSQRRIPWAFIL